MNGIKIKGTGQCLHQRVVTNEDLARIVETNDEWITTRTGIQRRHHISGEETITGLSAAAARQALENAGITADQIGACIVATLTPDTLVPSAACCLQRELGLCWSRAGRDAGTARGGGAATAPHLQQQYSVPSMSAFLRVL